MHLSYMANKYTVFLLFLLGLFISSCEEEVIRTVEVPVEVEAVPDFEELPQSRDPYRRIFQMHRFEDQLLLQGEDVHFFFGGEYGDDGSGGTTIPSTTRSLQAFNDQLYVHTGADLLYAQPVDRRFRFDNGPGIRMQFRDYLPEGYQLPSSINSQLGLAVLSQDNYIFLPYTTEDDRRLNFGIGQFQLPEFWLSADIELLSWENNVIDDDPATGYYYYGLPMTAVEGGFLIHIKEARNVKTYRVDYDGSYEAVFEFRVFDFFRYQGELYAYGRTPFTPFDYSIYRISPDGRNWTGVYQISNPANQFYQFHSTEDALFMVNSISDQIFLTTEMSEEGISFEALDAEELETYDITDIEHFGDFVYITTLSGFFRRPWQEFIDSRQEE